MTYRFGDFELDREQFRLLHSGASVDIEPKVFDVLLYLIEHRERVLTKRELLDALWPNETVSEAVLPRVVTAARRALGDDRATQGSIRTVHGRGYQFVARVETPPRSIETSIAVAPEPALRQPVPRGGAPEANARDDGPFVGRTDALEQLRGALERARKGSGSVVLVSGEPGIGKTRLAEELASIATSRGFRACWGRCTDAEGAPAFWPWVELLRASGELSSGTASGSAPAMPNLRAHGAESSERRGLDARQLRFELFDEVTVYLAERSQHGPLLLLLEDLHWADQASLLLLRFLTQRLRNAALLVLANYRHVDVRRTSPLGQILPELRREPACRHIHLSGLSRADTTAFLESAQPGPIPPSTVDAMLELTNGNPFYMKETVGLLRERTPARAHSDSTSRLPSLPIGVRDVVGRRFEALSEECVSVLEYASVIGVSFSLPLLGRFSSVQTDRLLELLDEAVARGLLREIPSSAGRYEFCHALIRQALYEGLSLPARVRRHRDLGLTLEESSGQHAADAQLEALAYHFFQGSAAGSAEQATLYGRRAAERALELLAYEEAARHAERALSAAELRVPADECVQCELLLLLGDALDCAGERAAMRKAFRRAADAARSLGRTDLLARAALGFAGRNERGLVDRESDRLLEEALAASSSSDLAWRSRLMARVGCTQLDLSAQAVALAERSGDRTACLETLAARCFALIGPDHVEERLAKANHLLEVANRSHAAADMCWALEARLESFAALGDLTSMDRELERYAALAESLRRPTLQFVALSYRVGRALASGDFNAAEELARQQLERGYRLGFPMAQTAMAWQLFWISRERGGSMYRTIGAGLEEIDPERVLDLEGERVLFNAAQLFHRCEIGRDLAGARQSLAELCQTARTMPRREDWLPLVALLAEVSARVGDEPRAAELVELLCPYAHLNVSHALGRTYLGSAAHFLAVAEAALGRTEQAIAHFERALDMNRSLQAEPFVAHTLLAYGRALLARGAPGERQRGLSLVAEAARIAERLGMQDVRDRGRALTAG